MPTLLVFGIGNPGRQDDALGCDFVDLLKNNLPLPAGLDIDFECNYQLNIEDSETISAYDQVLFADASLETHDSYKLEHVRPSEAKVEFTMHAVSPAFILDLCRKMFGKSPETYVLHIRGYEWELGQKMSPQALDNLQKSVTYIKQIIEQENRLILKP